MHIKLGGARAANGEGERTSTWQARVSRFLRFGTCREISILLFRFFLQQSSNPIHLASTAETKGFFVRQGLFGDEQNSAPSRHSLKTMVSDRCRRQLLERRGKCAAPSHHSLKTTVSDRRRWREEESATPEMASPSLDSSHIIKDPTLSLALESGKLIFRKYQDTGCRLLLKGGAVALLGVLILTSIKLK